LAQFDADDMGQRNYVEAVVNILQVTIFRSYKHHGCAAGDAKRIGMTDLVNLTIGHAQSEGFKWPDAKKVIQLFWSHDVTPFSAS